MSKDTFSKIQEKITFQAPDHWLRIQTIDMHTGGEPLRVIIGGFPPLKGDKVLEYRQYARKHYDHLRQALMHEPRGHADMYGCLLLPPDRPDSDFGILFLHNEGYSTMCGHAIIAITKLAVVMNWVEPQKEETPVTIDAPCGQIQAFAKMEKGQVSSVYFHCVPSFVVALDEVVDLPGTGQIKYDLAYGGAFYAYVDARQIGLELIPANYALLIQKGMDIKRAVMQQSREIHHPFEADLSFLYGTIFIGEPVTAGIDSRNVCIFAEGEVDRCPTGSGVSGRMAIHHQRNELPIGTTMTIESITRSVFTASIVRTTKFGPYPAVIPRVEGNAYLTGQHDFLIDPNDPFRHGFFLR